MREIRIEEILTFKQSSNENNVKQRSSRPSKNRRRMDCRVEKSRIKYYEKGREKRKEDRREENRRGEENFYYLPVLHQYSFFHLFHIFRVISSHFFFLKYFILFASQLHPVRKRLEEKQTGNYFLKILYLEKKKSHRLSTL